MRDFLLEIGTEEIPASFLKPAVEALEKELRTWFHDSRIPCSDGKILYTPRRLAVRFTGVAETQESTTVEVQGPPKRAAFDAEGKPTKTALGFARTHGKEVGDLIIRTTPKGEYVFVNKTTPAQPVTALLAPVLPEIIARLPFPKNMRWGSDGFRFARPIRWLVCLLGSEVLHFKIEDVSSENVTFGHRLASPNQAVIAAPADYESVLARLNVAVDPVQRRQRVLEAVLETLRPTGGELIPDDELLDETADTVEIPWPVVCDFAPEYLSLPPIVIVTALKKHQRCFAVRQPQSGTLLPKFVAVTNTPGCDTAGVRGWYEKAAESRLRDARFFIEEDRKIGLDGFLHEEEQVTWIEELGTLRDKTARLVRLCESLADAVNAPGEGGRGQAVERSIDRSTSAGPFAGGRAPRLVDKEALKRAALLCKADLLSNMVREKEYTSLQGIMGGIYARMQGESETTAQAIADHYAPRSVGDPLPVTVAGKLLSIADKLDNLAAAFVIGSIPTGSEDPFALRRQTTGVLMMMLELNAQIDLRAMLQSALELFEGKVTAHAEPPPRESKIQNPKSKILACPIVPKPADPSAILDQVCNFVRERLSLLLADKGIRYDVANAVLESSWMHPADARHRAEALTQFRQREDFERLALGQKRVANILKGIDPRATVDEKRLEDPSELALFDAARALEPELAKSVTARDYVRALEQLLSLRGAIDQFFDDVMVMCDDQELSANRLALVAYVRSLFRQVADLSQIVVETK